MSKYIFKLDSIGISNTRAIHEDTVHVHYQVSIHDAFGTRPFVLDKDLGDLNSGNFAVGLQTAPIDIPDSAASIAVHYQVVNSGHSDTTEIRKKLKDLGDELVAQAQTAWEKNNNQGNYDGPNASQSEWVKVAAVAVKAAIDWLIDIYTANCDGVVAVDTIHFDRAQLDSLSKNGMHSEERRYVGHQINPATFPCRDSDYTVKWTVERQVEVTFSPYASAVYGIANITLSAPGASAVKMSAYYATNPDDISTVGWHELGMAQKTPVHDGGEAWVYLWDTTNIPDQGNVGLGTVNLAAIALDQNGLVVGEGYHRFDVGNHGHEVEWKLPNVDSTLFGVVSLIVQASGVSSVWFDGYFATNPGDMNSVAWHNLGHAIQTSPGTWVYNWDTTTVPDQGNAGLGTVNVVVGANDTNGNQLSVPANRYRRFDIKNH